MKKFPLLLCLVYLVTTSFYPASSENKISQAKTTVKEIKLSPKRISHHKIPQKKSIKNFSLRMKN